MYAYIHTYIHTYTHTHTHTHMGGTGEVAAGTASHDGSTQALRQPRGKDQSPRIVSRQILPRATPHCHRKPHIAGPLCVCVRERVCVYISISIYIYIHIYIYLHAHTHTHTHTCMHAYIHIYMYKGAFVRGGGACRGVSERGHLYRLCQGCTWCVQTLNPKP